jgi:hypothetical protein
MSELKKEEVTNEIEPTESPPQEVKETPVANEVCKEEEKNFDEKAKPLDIRDPDLLVTSSSSSEVKSLTCAICMLLISDPQSFPCGHSFCKGLLLDSVCFVFALLLVIYSACSSKLDPLKCPIDRQAPDEALISAP